jgi:hypothetical protein
MMVLKQPPPNFLAPQPAATPLRSLLMARGQAEAVPAAKALKRAARACNRESIRHHRDRPPRRSRRSGQGRVASKMPSRTTAAGASPLVGVRPKSASTWWLAQAAPVAPAIGEA